MAINKAKLKTLTRLCEKGFDTHKKILAIDMRAARDNGLDDDISGILEDRDNPDSLIRRLSVAEAEKLEERGIVSGGMIPKVKCCIDAIQHGVRKVIILDGRVHHAIIMEILTNEGAGTMVYGEE